MPTLPEWLTCTDRNGQPLPMHLRPKCNQYRALHGLDPLPVTERTTNLIGSNNQLGKSRGLGDTIAKFTRATGIEKAVKTVAKAVGIEDCGCSKRQEKLNELVPYRSEKE
jgi:hypothetical protein